jgi:signal transduction histidine kinase
MNSAPSDSPGSVFRIFLPRRIVWKLPLQIGGTAVLVLFFTILLVYRFSSNTVRKQAGVLAMSEVQFAARSLDGFIAKVSMIPRAIAARQESFGVEPNSDWKRFLDSLLASLPSDEVFGAYIAYEDKRWDSKDAMLWVDRRSFPELATIRNDYHETGEQWYVAAKKSGRFHISEPYFDEGGSQINMISLTQPITINGRFIGVAGADVSLNYVESLVRNIRMEIPNSADAESSQVAYLVSKSGKIIVHPNSELRMRRGYEGKDLMELPGGREISSSPSGHVALSANGENRLVYWFTSPLTGWKLVLDVPELLVLEPVYEVTANTIYVSVAGLFLMMGLISILARRLTAPIAALGKVAESLETGNFDVRPLQGLCVRQDEIGGLANTFQSMATRIESRERDLAEWNQNLEATVRTRTAELAHAVEEARQAKDAAESANRTKSAFLANMSHELRTPMNAIIGYSEMLIEDATDSGQEDCVPDLKKIQSAGKHLLALINEVLDLSKIEAGKMTIYCEPIDIAAMIGEVRDTIEPLVAKNGNTLRCHIPEGVGFLFSDLTKIRQTLFNLLSNAAKFTHNGSIELRVMAQRERDEEFLRFDVIDKGIGLTPAQAQSLFQPFQQADDSTTRKYGGTGLGLAISRRFCRMLGGDLTVVSESGKGSTFTALIPRKSDPAGSPPRSK